MTENMKKLPELVSAGQELSAKIDGMGKEEIIALAGELGVELTDADFVRNSELSDDELDAVVGGASVGDHEAENRCDNAALSDNDLEQVSGAGDVPLSTMYPNVMLGRHARPDDAGESRP